MEDEIQKSIRYEFKNDPLRWERGVLGTRRTVESWKREARIRTRRNLLAEALWKEGREVSADEVYNEWLGHYGPDGKSVEVSLIRLDTQVPEEGGDEGNEDGGEGGRRRRGGGDGDGSVETLERLRAIKQRVLAGESFSDVALAESDDRESGANGGKLADGFHGHHWPAHVETEVMALEPGQISEPLEVGSSWVLIRMDGIREVPFESVEDELRREIESRPANEVELAAFINVLTRDVSVTSLPAMFL
jgi:hypothetical protein